MSADPASAPVILVEDDAALRDATVQALELSGFDVLAFDSAARAARYVIPSFSGCIVTDIRMAGMDGLQLFAKVMEIDRQIPVVLITGHGDIKMAVRAMQEGAFDFLAKPFAVDHLAAVVRKALETRQLVIDNRALRAALAKPGDDMVAQSPVMTQLQNLAAHVARTDIDLLIEGEGGTGKEMLARRIHQQSSRHARPFLVIPGSPPAPGIDFTTLAEHIAGGFLFVDGIHDVPLPAQAQLVAFLDARDRARIASGDSQDFRLIASTQHALSEGLARGTLSENLFHRLSSVTLRIPPLRERREDIPALFTKFVREALDQTGKKRFEMQSADRKRLLEHDWPGNVREVRNHAFAAVLNLPRQSLQSANGQAQTHLAKRLSAFEHMVIVETLEATRGNIVRACAVLGTPRKTLYEKLARLQIDPARFRAVARK